MIQIAQDLLPYKVLASHILLVILFLAIVSRRGWGKSLTKWVGKNALPLSFFVSLAAIGGSLFYSDVIGFEPCILCWWQRVFIYPLVLLYGIGLWKKDNGVFKYGAALASVAAVLAAYHSYVYLGGTSILPCTALGGACSKVYVMEFGYITIPMMSLTVTLYILVLAWARKVYENRNA